MKDLMHVHTAKNFVAATVMLVMSIYLIIGSLWIIFGTVLEPVIAQSHPGFRILLTSLSIVWSAISLIIAIYFIHKVRTIIKRVKHAGKA